MRKELTCVTDVVAWRLCLGCGACAEVCPAGALSLVDIEDDGLRPLADPGKCSHCGDCIRVCPGVAIEAPAPARKAIAPLHRAWGNVLEIWEGYACDPEIRYLGSSGGVATALSLFCLERQTMQGVLHIGPGSVTPFANKAVLSRTRDDLVARTGSRYAPAAPCAGLSVLKSDEAGYYAFVGKPCDVVALRKCQDAGFEAAKRIALTISIFCAGTPSTLGTRRLLQRLGVEPEKVTNLRYRGCGWPGRAVARMAGDNDDHSMSYEKSWGDILSKHSQFRCRLCPDSTGELADIACGDPWYREMEPGDPGRSLILVRTDTGRRVLGEAIKAGYVCLQKVEPDTLPRSQRALLKRRRHLWGRLLAMRLFRIPVPNYRGFSLLPNWRSLRMGDKVRSVLGTMHRIRQRGWNRPQT